MKHRCPFIRSSILFVLAAIGVGCSATPDIGALQIDADRYHETFDHALEAARGHGLTASVRDRRQGIIEAGPAIAPSLFEPWRPATSLERRVEHTIALERRRARFEFAPATDGDPPAPSGVRGALSGPDILGVAGTGVDRSRHDGPLLLQVRVYVEQSHKPGLRPATWSRIHSTSAAEFDESGARRPDLFWRPVSRDPALEQRLLADIERALGGVSQKSTS